MKGAQTGHSLLSECICHIADYMYFRLTTTAKTHSEKKADALTKRFRTITAKIADVRHESFEL